MFWVDQIGSTQDLAARDVHQLRHGDVIATDHQTAGRGRLDRSWDTPAGTAAAMSVVLRPTLVSQFLGTLTLVVADGLVRWFRELGVDATVKWPNDVLTADGKKLCGILAQWLPEEHALVMGIGTNLNLPQDARHERAAALADYDIRLETQDFVIAARQRILQAVDTFAANPDVKTLEPTMGTIGRRVKAIMPGGQDVVGTAIGLGQTGSLLVEHQQIEEVFAADIIHLRPA